MMKKECQFSENVIDFVYNELTGNELHEFQAHLSSCAHCQQKVEAISRTTALMSQRRRPLASKALLRSYHQRLQSIYENPKLKTSLWREFIENVIIHPSTGLRLAEVVVILVVGIFIGKNLSWNKTLPPLQEQNAAVNQVSFDKKFLENYLFESEFLLLEISNTDNENEVQSILEEIDCNKLLQKTIMLKEQALKINNPRLFELLERLEMILLELANLEKFLTEDELNSVRKNINESRLFVELKQLSI